MSGIKVDIAIIGMMKSGTTTIHRILEANTNIFIPKKEIHFFDQDNYEIHPDFRINLFNNEFVIDLNLSDWIGQVLPNKKIAIDATTLVYSQQGLERLLEHNSRVKIILCIRDLVDRFESHYWHLVQKGRIAGDNIVSDVASLPELFSRCVVSENIKFLRAKTKDIYIVDINRIKCDQDNIRKELSEFIGEDFSDFRNIQANSSRYPRVFLFRGWFIKLFGHFRRYAYADRVFPNKFGKFLYFVFKIYQVGIWFVSFGFSNSKPKSFDSVRSFVKSRLRVEQARLSEEISDDY